MTNCVQKRLNKGVYKYNEVPIKRPPIDLTKSGRIIESVILFRPSRSKIWISGLEQMVFIAVIFACLSTRMLL